MDIDAIIENYYPKGELAYSFLYPHSKAVAEMAVTIGEQVGDVDLTFIYEAAMLHDIGIFLTNAPRIGCHGKSAYISHGVLGEKLLIEDNLPKHALISRTHVGVALTANYIMANKLPLPAEDMVPHSKEEKIIAYADKFFSKRKEWLTTPKSVDVVIEEMSRFGDEPVKTFLEWHEQYARM